MTSFWCILIAQHSILYDLSSKKTILHENEWKHTSLDLNVAQLPSYATGPYCIHSTILSICLSITITKHTKHATSFIVFGAQLQVL